MPKLPYSKTDTDLLPEKRRITAWREAAASLWDVSAVMNGRFYARVEAYRGHEFVFGSIESSGQKTTRSAARIANDGSDYYMLQFYREGHREVTGSGREHVINPGDVLVVDMTQPITTIGREYKSTDIAIPRRLLANHLHAPDSHGARRLEGNRPLTALLCSHLIALNRSAPGLSHEDMLMLQSPTLAMIAAALNGEISPESAAGMTSGIRLAVQRYIEQNLHDLGLTVQDVAKQFGISRATLYRIMDKNGGFVSYLRLRRLHRCRGEISDPRLSHKTIAQVAERWGFTNSSTFSVSFQRAFGMSPRDCRQVAFGLAATKTAFGDTADWSKWLLDIR